MQWVCVYTVSNNEDIQHFIDTKLDSVLSGYDVKDFANVNYGRLWFGFDNLAAAMAFINNLVSEKIPIDLSIVSCTIYMN